MARDIPIANGCLLVAFDADYRIRDLYFPHVGQENHVGGHACRFGFFVDGAFSWVGPDWRKALDYEDDTLVTHVRLVHERLALDVACRDAVDFHENVMVREVRVRNLADRARVVKAFLSHDFHVGDVAVANTAFYDPQLKAVIHYRGSRYLLANVSVGERAGVDEWATGTKEFGGKEGTWRDAEDGRLEGNAIAQGSVDSTVAVTLSLGAGEEERFFYWLAAGTSYREVKVIDAVVRDKGPAALLHRTAHYWRAWLAKSSPARRPRGCYPNKWIPSTERRARWRRSRGATPSSYSPPDASSSGAPKSSGRPRCLTTRSRAHGPNSDQGPRLWNADATRRGGALLRVRRSRIPILLGKFAGRPAVS